MAAEQYEVEDISATLSVKQERENILFQFMINGKQIDVPAEKTWGGKPKKGKTRCMMVSIFDAREKYDLSQKEENIIRSILKQKYEDETSYIDFLESVDDYYK